MATSKPSLRVELDAALLAQVRAMPKPARREIGELIEDIRGNFGHPHRHLGAGIRRLGPGLYEGRRGLSLRLLFTFQSGCLYFHFLGNHDEVKKFIREHR